MKNLKYLAAVSFFLLLFAFFQKEAEAISCSPEAPATTCSTSESVVVTAVVPDTTITFSGYAPAGAVVYFKEGEFIVGSTVTNNLGVFSKTITSTPGSHTYLIYLTDTTGLSTPEVTLEPINLITQTDIPVTNIHLPPTITVSKNKVAQDSIVSVYGQGSPGATIAIYINGVKKFSARVGNDSTWRFELSATNLPDQSNFYAVSSRVGLPDSQKSQTVSLEVLACSGESCNRITQLPPNIATPSAPTESKNNSFTFRIELGNGFGDLILPIILVIFITLILIILIILLLAFRHRRSKEKTLADLEKAVVSDLRDPNPSEKIHQDFADFEDKAK